MKRFFFLLVIVLLLAGCSWDDFASGGAKKTPRVDRSQVVETMITCTDPDGLDPFVKGVTKGASTPVSQDAVSATDRCMVEREYPSHVMEYHCEGSLIKFKIIECEHGCEDGACIQEEAVPAPQQVPSQEVLQLAFPVLVNGQYPPPSLARGEEFTVSWDAAGLRDCAGSGNYIMLPDDTLWTDQSNLPSTGSMRLTARHKNLPNTPSLQLMVRCFDDTGNSYPVSVIIPVTD